MSTSAIRLPFVQSDAISRASMQIDGAVRNGDDVAVMLIHVHGIERLCASIGHGRASQVMDDFSDELRSIARDKDEVERVGDRKFVMLLHGLRNRGHVSLAAQKIARAVRGAVSGQLEERPLNASIGIALCPEHGRNGQELLRLVEIASLDGWRKREAITFYEANSANQLFMDWGLEVRLNRAMECGDLELYFQPQISCRTGEIIGAEALMRWHEPEIGPISPDVFIELAESTGQIVDLTHFAIQQACRVLNGWQASMPNLNVAINITPSIIQTSEIVDVIKSASSIWDIKPDNLTMEVTENALMTDREASHEVLTNIRDFGARVSIDDFGTGYSSFAYLKELPADELKIDRSFVMGMLTDSGDAKIVEHSIGIAKSFGLAVVAEGVEDKESLEALQRMGCDIAQGYYVCKPLPADEFISFCQASRQ